jgi:hypothetical protein
MHRGPGEGSQSLGRMTGPGFTGSKWSCPDVPLEMKGLGNWLKHFLVSAGLSS